MTRKDGGSADEERAPAPSLPPRSGPEAARRLGPYRLGEVLSTRGLTATYRAEHEPLGRRARVRALKPAVAPTPAFAARVEREARTYASLDHEAIARLYEVGRDGQAVWIAFEEPGGASLADVLARAARLPPDVALAVALGAARGLAHAHERGVTHGALAPDAIELTPDGGLVLFGFLPGGGDDALGADPFEVSEAFSRPDYMAPEQVAGDAPGPPADVFALGAILFEMLAGARPFDARDRRDVARRIRDASPAPLPDDAPRSAARIVARCLAKHPADRFEDAGPLVEALEAALAERTRASDSALVSRALSLAKLGHEVKARGERSRPSPREASRLGPALARSLALFTLIALGGAFIELTLRDDPAGSRAAASPDRPGYLRVLATPWADVLVDGELVDTTPVARPLPVAPGVRHVTFRHPNAPDEQRTVSVDPGQTVLLDVAMRIDRPPAPDAGSGSPDGGDDSP
jgi:serine/threonine-protein kinase